MREAISKKRRFDVFKRDGFACQYCGATPPGVLLHVDHINPVALGGKSGIDNLNEDSWDVAAIFMEAHCRTSIRKDYRRSIKTFLEKLPKQEVVDAMDRALGMAKGHDGTFRYFCGICWNKIKEGA